MAGWLDGWMDKGSQGVRTGFHIVRPIPFTTRTALDLHSQYTPSSISGSPPPSKAAVRLPLPFSIIRGELPATLRCASTFGFQPELASS